MNYETPSSRPRYSGGELEAVKDVLQSGHTAEGPRARQLEEKLAEQFNVSDAVVTSSGTASIHLSLLALGIEENDEVILPSYVCQSVLNGVHHAGATPVLADVDPETMSLSPETVGPKITDKTALVILVHAFGYPVNAPDLFNEDIPVLEDVAQAVGAHHDGQPVGSRGIAGIGSLYATKQISAGYGGFVISDNDPFLREIRDLKTYDERDEYRVSYNYSLSDLHASVAEVQLETLDERLKNRRAIADEYDEVLDAYPSLKSPERPAGHACYRYVIQSKQSEIFETGMKERGVEVKRPVYHPLHHDLDQSNLPESERLHREARLIPLLPDMSDDEINHVLDSIEATLSSP